VVLPKNIREKAKMRERGYVKVTAKEKSIIIQPLEPFADKYFGAFEIDKWPEVLDEFMVEFIEKWWASQTT